MAEKCITRGTDASLALGCDKLGFAPSDIEAIYFRTWQRGYDKTWGLSDWEIDGSVIRFNWSRSETFEMKPGDLRIELYVKVHGKVGQIKGIPERITVNQTKQEEPMS